MVHFGIWGGVDAVANLGVEVLGVSTAKAGTRRLKARGAVDRGVEAVVGPVACSCVVLTLVASTQVEEGQELAESLAHEVEEGSVLGKQEANAEEEEKNHVGNEARGLSPLSSGLVACLEPGFLWFLLSACASFCPLALRGYSLK